MSDSLKDIWNILKKIGKFDGYESYEDWREKKYGEKKKFIDTLEGKEREQYLEMFGEDEE